MPYTIETNSADCKGFAVVDGDETDLRFMDGAGKIVGLKEKGLAKKDETGFVLEPSI